MKKINQQLLILIISILPAMQVQSSIVDFRADSTSLIVGETLEISIFAEDFDELAGGTIDFSISTPSSLSVDNVLVDSRWDFAADNGRLDGNNWIGIGFDVFANEPVNGDAFIAKVIITGVDVGITTLTLLNSSTFFSTTEELVTDEIINTVGFDVAVQAAVPLPGAVWLMGSALFGLARLRRTTSVR